MYHFDMVDLKALQVDEYYCFNKKGLFTTLEWINFIVIDQKAKSIIIRITKDTDYVGYFTGFLFQKFGIKIMGSPFEGWSTAYMGFDIKSSYSRVDLIEPISKFMFETLKCLFIEITDRYIDEKSLLTANIKYTMSHSVELRVDKSNEELLKAFNAHCRNTIRQFERRGATIEIADADEEFAQEYYDQCKEVFAKQNLVPPYRIKKVLDLFHSLSREQLLCLRVRNPEGLCIATTIFVGYNKRFYFWGAASYREFQMYRPNESLIWYAIRNFRDKGYEYFDMCGERDYKNKFNPDKISYPCIMMTKFPILILLKNLVKTIYWWWLKIQGFGKRIKTPNTTTYKQKGLSL